MSLQKNEKLETVDPAIIRKQNIQERLNNGENIYIHKWECKNHINEIIKKYENILEINENENVQSAGRILTIRNQSKLCFIDVLESGAVIQLIISKTESQQAVLNDLYRGDIIGFNGNIMRSKTGQLSIKIEKLKLLTPCVKTLPTQYYGVKDPEFLYRRRYIDIILNTKSRQRFITRTKIISYLRNFLDTRNFVEVETPVLDMTVGGANAKPFTTYHNDLKLDMFMRVSPELYHKKLIVGGLERVYEIGRVFRNEGVDLTHNPEFTSCEFYMAYADYHDLITITEEFLSGLVKNVCGSNKIKYTPEKRNTEEAVEIEIDFTGPFRKIDMLEELSKCTGLNLTGENIEKMTAEMIDYCEKEKLNIDEPKTTARVIDKLVGHFIEPQCTNPTFIINHPMIMSPLAKAHRSKPGLTERFELFINGKEICNAYTELNDPFDQRRRFLEQAKDKDMGDDEAMMMDDSFVEALEYGLPPTGGWGIGIDRLTMFLTSAANIRDVILFPTMRPESK